MSSQNYYNLPYTHEELKMLLQKMVEGKMLSVEDYTFLVNDIGLENISTFSGSYDDLSDKPKIPQYINDLNGVEHYATNDSVDRKMAALYENIVSLIAEDAYKNETVYANRVELENLALTLQNYADKKVLDTVTKIDLTGFAGKSEVKNKAERVHQHQIADIKDLYYELEGKARISHNHDYSYAAKAYEHLHADLEALNNITQDKIDGWDNHITEINYDIIELRSDFLNLDKDFRDDIENRHSHANLDTLNKIFPEDILRWDTVANTAASNAFDTRNKLTTANVGGVSEGADLSGLSIHDVLRRILYPDKKYEITASIVLDKSGTVFEKGTTVTVTQIRITVVEQGSNAIKEILFYGNGEVIQTLTSPDSSAGSFVYDVNAVLSDSIPADYFRVQLKDSTEVIVKANTSAVNFYYPMYYGVVDNGVVPSAAMVKGMTKKVAAKGTQTCTFNLNKQCAVFAYPASYGSLTSILDPNNFEQIRGFTTTTVSIVGADGQAQNYNVYIGPANTNTGFKMTFKF